MQTTFRQENIHDLTPEQIDKIEFDLNGMLFEIDKTINAHPKHKIGIVLGAINTAFQHNLWAEDIDQVYEHYNINERA